jgi:hypothetical protein
MWWLRNLSTDTTRGEKLLIALTLIALLVTAYVTSISHHMGTVLTLWSGVAVLVAASIWSVHRGKGGGF